MSSPKRRIETDVSAVTPLANKCDVADPVACKLADIGHEVGSFWNV